jgi:Zn-dependent protease
MIHEIAHGSMALSLGDRTAKEAGRLTLNPLKHIDLFGTILLPLVLLVVTAGHGPIFGWAKPVPVNPFNLREGKRGILKVSLAGSATNFLIAVFFSLAVRFLVLPPGLEYFFGLIALYNFAWGIFNLLPLPPLDGSWILFTFLPQRFSQLKIALQQYGFYLLLIFILFGLNFVFDLAAKLFGLLAGQAV